MRRLLLIPLTLCLPLAAQTPTKASAPPQTQATPQLSPQAAYDQASTPIDITHRVFANWSDIEKNALYVAIAKADDACLARKSETYTGDDLIAYARLCDLGEEWPAVYTAATLYINSKDPKPQLALAYAFEVKADLKLGHEKAAAGACVAMLQSVPYGPIPDEVTSTTIRYLQFAYTSEALDLLAQRQPFLLNTLRTSSPSTTPAPPNPAPAPSIALHTVFEHALDFAALEQYVNQPRLAAAILTDIDQAMPPALPPDEAIFIAADRRQYALLGTHFSALPGAISLLPAKEMPPTQPNFGSATFFFLFPPWCAQCIRQAQDLIPSMVRTGLLTGSDKIHIYALLADTPPPPPAPPAKPAAPTAAHHSTPRETPKPPGHPTAVTIPAAAELPPTAEEQLRKTPTLVVAPSTLAVFNAADFPFLIATDHEGIIRLLVPAAPDNALAQNGAVDQITANLLANWPPPPAKP